MILKKGMMSCAIVALLVAGAGCDKDDDNNNNNNNNAVNAKDREFTSMAAMSNRAEIDAATLALSNGQDSSIKAFAQMMITDHTNAMDQLDSLATSLTLSAPDSLDAAHVALKQQLSTLNGRAFDSLYIHSQVMDHQQAISLFTSERDSGSNMSLKNYAISLLPHLQQHLQMADSLSANY